MAAADIAGFVSIGDATESINVGSLLAVGVVSAEVILLRDQPA